MNKYELTVILKPNLDEETQNADFERINVLFERFECSVEKVDDWGKRKLAYEIEKQGEGFYRFITFHSGSDAPAEIEKRIRIMENVLRFLIIRVEE